MESAWQASEHEAATGDWLLQRAEGTNVADGPEPTGWELMRGIDGLRGEIRELASGMVSQTMFSMYQTSAAAEMHAAREQAKQDANDAKAAARAAQTAIEEMRKEKARNNFTLLMTFITAVLGLGTSLVLVVMRVQ